LYVVILYGYEDMVLMGGMEVYLVLNCQIHIHRLIIIIIVV